MRIAIDARSYGARHFTGVGRYVAELVRALEQRPGDHEYVVVLCDLNADEYRPAHPAFRRVVSSARPYTVREQLAVPALLHRLGPDLAHFPANFGPLGWRGRRVTTVHDLSMIEHPPIHHAGWRGRVDALRAQPARLAMWEGIRASEAVITVSRTTAEALGRRYRVDPALVSVAYQGVRTELSDAEDRPEAAPAGPFLFTVGLAYPHKNLHRLLDAFALLRASRPELSLVIAGRDDEPYRVLRSRAGELGLGAHAVFPGRVSEAELRWLYRHTALYVFPSLAEGFGLPGLEAMAHGAPVIASSASCLPEVYGDAAAYLRPTRADEMAADIGRLLDDPGELRRLAAGGPAHAARFTWEATGAATLETYDRLAR